MANYTKERSRYGGYTGSIIIHTVPGMGSNNDPTTAIFKDNVPAGYLRCDGSVLNAKDYIALSEVLGVGAESRFRREDVTLRDADPELGDLGQFQLPDLGSKVFLGGRASGTYNNETIDRGEVTTARPENRVGPQIEVISNFGNVITAGYTGFGLVTGESDLPFLGNPSYKIQRNTTSTELTIENFQGHAHNANQNFLNFTGNHEVGGDGGKDFGRFGANSGSYNELGVTSDGGRESIHSHSIGKSFEYNNEFRYAYDQTQVDMSGVTANVTVDVSDEEKIDQLVTPFILVQYLIKF